MTVPPALCLCGSMVMGAGTVVKFCAMFTSCPETCTPDRLLLPLLFRAEATRAICIKYGCVVCCRCASSLSGSCVTVQAWAGVDVAALAQYLTHTLRSGQAFDLLLLKELVSVMTVRR